MFRAVNITHSGMGAAKEWMDAIANNIANVNTTRSENGGPYHRQTVSLKEKTAFENLFNKQIGNGVEVDSIVEDSSEKLVYDPEHPDAGEDGYVRYPAIDMVAEIANMVMAQRSYEANVSVFNAEKEVLNKTLEIGRL